tara:strand:- start:3194 stop:3862 length:669 start_codon:yes stop_codon:yes gene_type:complete
MLTKPEKTFSIIFTIILMAELICDNIESLNLFHYFTKPLILILLIWFFLKQVNHLDTKTKYITLFALLFSLTGDILLMFSGISTYFFIGGLFAFLLAHGMYILVFLKKKNNNNNKVGFLILILLTYAAIVFYFLKDGLGDLLVPVIIYLLTILTMAIMAFSRRGSVSEISYILVFLGALFFITSDSLLALNKFYVPFKLADILIMPTYAIAQYLIVLGLKKQ